MGGTSSSNQQQQSTTAPWTAAQPALSGILGQLGGLIPNSGVTPGENGDISQIVNNAAGTTQFNPQINNVTSSLLAGGGANNQAGNINQAYQQYQAATNPLATNTNYNPMSTPGIGDALAGLNNKITQQVNGSFAGAGRDGSGANAYALASGLASGEAPVLTNQYNANVQNQQGAAGNIYNAANSSNALLSGLQQQYVANQQAGVQGVGTGLQAQNSGPGAALAAQLQGQNISAQNLGLLAQIGVPIAGLGSQSTGQSNGTNTMSGAQQFGTIASGIGSMIPKGAMTFNF